MQGCKGASRRLSSAIFKALSGLEACMSACWIASLRTFDMVANTLEEAMMSRICAATCSKVSGLGGRGGG